MKHQSQPKPKSEPNIGPNTIIGLCGPIGSGKSTVAGHLVTSHGFTRVSLASPLKAMFEVLLNFQHVPPLTIRAMISGDLKEHPTEFLSGRSPREAMQTLGTEWGRALAPDFWLNIWTRSITGLPRVVVDDVRFPNEAHAIHRLGGRLIALLGREDTSSTSSSHSHHSSETQDIRSFADVFVPNYNTLPDLYQSVDHYIEHFQSQPIPKHQPKHQP